MTALDFACYLIDVEIGIYTYRQGNELAAFGMFGIVAVFYLAEFVRIFWGG